MITSNDFTENIVKVELSYKLTRPFYLIKLVKDVSNAIYFCHEIGLILLEEISVDSVYFNVNQFNKQRILRENLSFYIVFRLKRNYIFCKEHHFVKEITKMKKIISLVLGIL